VKEILEMNRKKIIPDTLQENSVSMEAEADVLNNDLVMMDKKFEKKKKKKKRSRNKNKKKKPDNRGKG
jgi:hypothetical protein